MPSLPGKTFAPGTWVRVGAVVPDGSATARPGHRSVVGHEARFEGTSAEIRIGVRSESVQQAFRVILGQVQHLVVRIHRDGFVSPPSHRLVGDRGLGPRGVAFEDAAGLAEILLTAQPRAPRSRPAGAVGVGAFEDAVGVEDLTVAAEVDGRDAAGIGSQEVEDLAVAGVVPPARSVIEGGRAIGEQVPRIAGRADRLPGDGHDA